MNTNQHPIQPEPPPLACPPKETKGDIIFRIAYIIILSALFLLCALFIMSRNAQAQSSDSLCGSKFTGVRFISPWTDIPPHSTQSFKHGFKCSPLELDVWASASSAASSAQGSIVRPYLEYKGKLSVINVNYSEIYIKNTSDQIFSVQVVAVP